MYSLDLHFVIFKIQTFFTGKKSTKLIKFISKPKLNIILVILFVMNFHNIFQR